MTIVLGSAVALTAIAVLVSSDLSTTKGVFVLLLRVAMFGLLGIAVGLIADRHIVRSEPLRILIVLALATAAIVGAAGAGLFDEKADNGLTMGIVQLIAAAALVICVGVAAGAAPKWTRDGSRGSNNQRRKP